MGRSRGKDLAVNTIVIAIGKFSTQLVSFLLLPLYTSILTTEEYGIYDLFVTVSAFLLPVMTLLMEESMFRFLIDSKTDEDKKKIISQTILYISASTLIFMIIAALINIFVNIPYFMLGVAYIVTCIISALRNALVRGMGRLKLYTGINFISSLIHIILNVIFIAGFRWGVYGLLIAGIISNLLSSVIVFLKLNIFKYISIRGFDKKMMKSMIKYSMPLVPNSLSWSIVNLSDRLVISSFLNPSANGIYAMSYKFPNIMDTIYGFFYTAWKESSAKAVKDSDKEQFFNKIYKMLTSAMFSVSIGIIACMPIFFSIFIKSAYNEAYLYIPILVVAMYYSNISGYYGGIFSGYKDTKIMGTTTAAGAAINLIVDLVLIKFIGIYAAAISTMISCMVIFYYRKHRVKKYVNLKNNNMVVGIILFTITTILYYINTNIIIKILNILVVGIYALLTNKEMIQKLSKPIMNKLKKNRI